MDVIEKYGVFVGPFARTGRPLLLRNGCSWNFIAHWNISLHPHELNEGLTLEQATANIEKVVNKEAGNVTDRWILHESHRKRPLALT